MLLYVGILLTFMKLLSPYVAVAVFCREARQNPDGTLTIAHVLDRITVDEAAGQLPRAASLVAVIALRSEPPLGAHELGLDVHSPSGGRRPVVALPVDTSAEGGAIARILKIDFEIEEFGDYWFGVMWDNRPVSRMKLQVRARTI